MAMDFICHYEMKTLNSPFCYQISIKIKIFVNLVSLLILAKNSEDVLMTVYCTAAVQLYSLVK